MLQNTGITMSIKPASRLIAKALPRNGRFAGQFALPGLIPDLVRDDNGVRTFDDERMAEIAAMEAVIRLYESRTIDTRKAGGYIRLTGAELAVLIDEMNTTPTYFAEICGVPQSRVMKWLDGEQDIPHSVHVLAKLLVVNKANFDVAEKVTQDMQEET
ncbi:hypothetical protein PMI07_000838 [Rhizobium sp. CF080]|uniref:hypothetical protein n=1 Tax=Rhizobium sp. (strain CF080) TaxID=1144310 RepID=UPI000271BCB4|nr:hypothetical protein [Rhizobium sp. CF080]EUB97262.1 hypothetical protein PMI07_000838 [Rhizobium sp. CF080]